MADKLFTEQFLSTIKSLVEQHHTLYPWVPPQGIFFESLVQQAFRRCGWTDAQVVPTATNSPQHDLLVGKERISIKTETGKGTKPELISITKLCTTEREPWDSPTLVQHAMGHLSRYDRMLMMRAIWRQDHIHYQLLAIPLKLLKLIGTVTAAPVGRREGRRSLAADVVDRGEVVFHVHFDGADGKCQVQRLLVGRCKMMLEWDQPINR